MPYIPLSLHELLVSPRFSPYAYALEDGSGVSTNEEIQSRFIIISRSIIAQICAALAYLHGHDIAHRDIKPQNILVVNNGSTYPSFRLIDFGLATVYTGWKARYVLLEQDALTNFPTLYPDFLGRIQGRHLQVAAAGESAYQHRSCRHMVIRSPCSLHGSWQPTDPGF